MLGAGAAGTAGTAGAGLGVGGFLKTAFAIGTTVVGGLAEMAAANDRAEAFEADAEMEDFNARQEQLTGKIEAANALEALNENLAQITVAGFGAGLRSSGSVQSAREDAIEAGERNVDTARDNAEIAAGARRANARQRRMDASASRRAGMFGALRHGMNFASRFVARG